MRDGEEPLVPDERPSAVAVGQRARLGLAQVRAALLLGHRHAHRGAGLPVRRGLARVVGGGGDEPAPLGPEGGVAPQDGHGRVGHPDRAADAVLALVPQVGQGRARHLRPGSRVGPTKSVRFLPDGEAHQLVPSGVEFDAVHPVPEAVVGPQLGEVAVRLPRRLLDPRRAHGPPRLAQARLRPPPGPEGGNHGAERPVRAVGVVIREGRRLVQHLVRRVAVAVERSHGRSSPFGRGPSPAALAVGRPRPTWPSAPPVREAA